VQAAAVHMQAQADTRAENKSLNAEKENEKLKDLEKTAY
jgi:hypothetical protein